LISFVIFSKLNLSRAKNEDSIYEFLQNKVALTTEKGRNCNPRMECVPRMDVASKKIPLQLLRTLNGARWLEGGFL